VKSQVLGGNIAVNRDTGYPGDKSVGAISIALQRQSLFSLSWFLWRKCTIWKSHVQLWPF